VGYPSDVGALGLHFALYEDVLIALLGGVPFHAIPSWLFGIWGTALLWILFCAIAAVLAAMVALGCEQVVRLRGLSRRWVWAASIAATLLLPAGLYFAPAALHPGRFLPHPHSALSPDGKSAGGRALEFEWRTAPGIRDAPKQFEIWLPDYHTVTVELGDGPRADRVGRALVLVWIGASAVVLAIVLRGFVVLARRRRGGRPAVVAGVPVVVADGLGPAVVGVSRLSIVLPRWALTMDAAMRRQMLLHEGQHIRAGDPYLLLFAALALVLMPWSPGLWWQIRRLRLAIEIDCDARVLRMTGDPAAYGTLLLEVGRRVSRPPAMATGLAHPFSLLEGRIRALSRRVTPGRALKALLALSLAAGAARFAWDLDSPPHRWPYLAWSSPMDGTTRNAEFQLRARTLTTRLLQEWSRTLPAVHAYLRREHPEIYGCTGEDDLWDLTITAEDGGRLLAVRAIPGDTVRNAGFELGTAYLPPIKWGREYPDLLQGVRRELSGSNTYAGGSGNVVSPCIDDFTYRVMAPAGAPPSRAR